MIVSMAIGVDDNPAAKKEAGRIVAIMPENHKWGTYERNYFLIVKIDLGSTITNLNDASKLLMPELDTGELYWTQVAGCFDKDLPHERYLSRRRYKIPIPDIVLKAQQLGVTLDLTRLHLQPLKDRTIPFTGMIQDKVKKKKIVLSDLVAIRDVDK